VESVANEGSDEYIASMKQDTLDEHMKQDTLDEQQHGLDWNGQLCANFHHQPSFEHHPDIAVALLPYYFDIQSVGRDSVRFR
jgi:hypothetical protein